MGPSSSQWVQVGVHLRTTTVPQTGDCAVRAQGSSYLRRDREDGREGSNPGGKGQNDRWLSLQAVSGSQEGRPDAASVKPKATEQVYIQAFQNGGNAHSERSTAERRLDDKNQHQRCILHDSNSPTPSEISEVSVERKMLSVYVPPIWTGVCPKGFHEDLEASSGIPEQQRYVLCCLHRRPSFAAPGQGKAERILSNSLGSARIAGIFDKLSQVSARTNSKSGIPWIHYQLCGKGTESSCREVRENCGGSQNNVEVPYSLSPVTCPAHREDDSSYPGSLSSSFALSRSVAPQASGLEEEGLQSAGDIVTRSSQGPALVGGKPSHLGWESSSRGDHRCGDRDRCLKNGLGSFLPGNPDRRLLECSESRTSHQFPGNVSSILCNQSLHQGLSGNLSFTAYGQHVCGDLCQSNGGEKVSVTYSPGNRSLVLVPTEKNHSCSTVHSRARKYHSRLPVKASKRQDGLGVRTHHFQLCEHSVGPASGGSFCNTFFKATSPFLQLATGPQSRGHRCFCTELDQYPRLCTSSLVPNFTSPSESSSRPSNSGAHHPIMPHAVVVPSLNEPPGRLSTPPAKDGRGN